MSAPITTLITTQHPELLAHEEWAAHLSTLLTAVVESTEQGELESLQRCWHILMVRARADRATCKHVFDVLEKALPASIRKHLRRSGVGPRGRRFDIETLRDHDLVARQQHKDRYHEAGLEVRDEVGTWSPAVTNTARIAAVVETRVQVSADETVLDSPEMRRVENRTRRVANRTIPLHYTFVPCGLHERMAELDLPTPGVWDGRDLASAEAIERSRTVTFCPRIALPGSTGQSVLETLAGDWLVIAR